MATAETRHLRREALDEALDEIDRAVLATGATDAEGEIAAVGGAVFGDALAQRLARRAGEHHEPLGVVAVDALGSH
jgi:hypothetical protein